MLKNKKMCIIKPIQFSEIQYKLTGILFAYHYNLCGQPVHSSKLNRSIFYVKKITNYNAFTFDIEQILCKCMLPFKEGYAVFPINHSF